MKAYVPQKCLKCTLIFETLFGNFDFAKKK